MVKQSIDSVSLPHPPRRPQLRGEGISSPNADSQPISSSPESPQSAGQLPEARQSISTPPGNVVGMMMPNSATRDTASDEAGHKSIDSIPNSTAFLLGDTGESDPYLLRHLSTAEGEGSIVSKVRCRHISTGDEVPPGSGRPLVLYLADHSLYDHGEPRIEESELKSLSDEIHAMCPHEVAVRLARLYFRYVYPYFPILSRSHYLSKLTERWDSSPLSLKAALMATGLSFITYDDVLVTTLAHSLPSAQRLWQIVWIAATHEAHTPHLATLQACLLLLQRVNDDRHVMDTAFRWSLLGWTIALAQSLGLSTDCSNWQNVPTWEKRLRRRLWWAVYVIDKWSFMSAGLASHIRNEDFDVAPLTAEDFQLPEPPGDTLNQRTSMDHQHPESHFFHLVELSRILADILDAFFSLRAASKTQRDFALSLEIAKPLRSRLKEWKLNFDAFVSNQRLGQLSRMTSYKLDGNASLGLAYPVATIILFRALLRPLESPSSSALDANRMEAGREAVYLGAKACCIESVEFVEGLKRNVWDAFWHSWSRAGFATVSSLMVRLLITTESPAEKHELNDLIGRWRWALRTGGGNSGNVLMTLGLLRLNRSLITKGIYENPEEED